MDCGSSILNYGDSQVAGNNRLLYPKVDPSWFKVAHKYEPLALQVDRGLPGQGKLSYDGRRGLMRVCPEEEATGSVPTAPQNDMEETGPCVRPLYTHTMHYIVYTRYSLPYTLRIYIYTNIYIYIPYWDPYI